MQPLAKSGALQVVKASPEGYRWLDYLAGYGS
ncbi:hypothetical protein GGE12_006845 [Rhizobium mongolense]|uniref:Uncharacterized protein n=1 Tax=Rhizobium mongolense TaxID=57676 RepID=A0A7W6RV60_9HYPH|nr:hypothetical protein [Rhizobium mongolense]